MSNEKLETDIESLLRWKQNTDLRNQKNRIVVNKFLEGFKICNNFCEPTLHKASAKNRNISLKS